MEKVCVGCLVKQSIVVLVGVVGAGVELAYRTVAG